MKPMSLLVACGIVVSLALAAPAGAVDQHKRQPRGQRDQQTEWRTSNGSGVRQTVPRGDLRGDIASNARARVEARAPEALRHH